MKTKIILIIILIIVAALIAAAIFFFTKRDLPFIDEHPVSSLSPSSQTQLTEPSEQNSLNPLDALGAFEAANREARLWQRDAQLYAIRSQGDPGPNAASPGQFSNWNFRFWSETRQTTLIVETTDGLIETTLDVGTTFTPPKEANLTDLENWIKSQSAANLAKEGRPDLKIEFMELRYDPEKAAQTSDPSPTPWIWLIRFEDNTLSIISAI